MGAPKQKWTAAEEAALRAGILKHGTGKWRLILKDPEFSKTLELRSNVDLKDKWRNMHTPRGSDRTDTLYGPDASELSRARLGHKRSQPHIKREVQSENPLFKSVKREVQSESPLLKSVKREVQSDDDMVETKPKPIAVAGETLSVPGSEESTSRLDSLIIKAIASLDERNGSNRTSVGTYIEENYDAPPTFKRILTAKLKLLLASGKLIKVKRNYMIAPDPASSERSIMPEVPGEAKQGDSPDIDEYGDQILTEMHVTAELKKMRVMMTQQAAAAAARAVAEAQERLAKADRARQEAEEAEADYEAAKAFAEAAKMSLKARSASWIGERIFT